MARKTKKSDGTDAALVSADEVLPSDPQAEALDADASDTIDDAEVVARSEPEDAQLDPQPEPTGDEYGSDDHGTDDHQPDEVPEDEMAQGSDLIDDPAEVISDDATIDASTIDVDADTNAAEASPDTETREADRDGSHDGPALAPIPPATVVEKHGPGFVPLVLGGVVAGLIGWAVATYGPQTGAVAGDDGRYDELQAEIAALRDGGVDGATADTSEMGGRIAEQSERVDALEDRIAALEGQASAPEDVADASTAGLSSRPALEALGADVEAVQADLDALGQEVAALADLPARIDGARSELGGRINALEARIGDVASEAETAEDRAENLARDTARNQLRLAMESGQPYAEQLEILGDAPPELVAGAETGLPTFGALAGDFPALAREALRTSRASETETGLGSLAGRLLNARSIEPREGDDPDAVLSRAEAALALGDLDGALAELDALPDDARAVMTTWLGDAQMRRDAQAALQTYIQDE